MSFSFGTPSSAPATSSLAGGFSFGANKPATPGFGLTATSQPSSLFGGTPATSAPAFGTTTPAFGATATPAFGATTTPAFGAASTAPAFGATTTTTPAFGAASTAPTLGTGLGGGLGGGLGTGLGFGTTTSTPSTGLSFGAPTATSTSTGLGGGLGGFGFGATAASTAQTSGFGMFNTATTATTSTGLFGAKLGTTSVTGTLPSATVTPSLGLGGISTLTGVGATNTTSSDGKTEPPKQTKLPNEILTNVENFKEFVKKQKSISSDIMRVSIKPLHKVSQDAEELTRSVLTLSGEVRRSRAQCKRLRQSGAQALLAAETCVSDAPSGCAMERGVPPALVCSLVTELERGVLAFRRHLDAADTQLTAHPTMLSEQELTLGIRRMHEALVSLAGRLQTAHAAVQAQKEQYLALRKHLLNDHSDVFEAHNTSSSLEQILREADKQRKKSKTSIGDSLTEPRTKLGNVHHLAGPTPFSYIGNGSPSNDTSVGSWQGTVPAVTPVSFTLQRPPGKRGKP